MDDRLMHEMILAHFDEASQVISQTTQQCLDTLVRGAKLIGECLKCGGKVLVCGNGGSAADAQHFAGELVGRFLLERNALPAISLTVDPSVLTSIANDMSFEHVFSRQLDALGRQDDVLVCLTTSGRSPNIIAAARKAKDIRMKVLCLTGKEESALARYADIIVAVPSTVTPHIQEVHGIILHAVCQTVEKTLFG